MTTHLTPHHLPSGDIATKTGSLMRFGLVLPIAVVATIGLLVSMASLISAEFEPQDKVVTPSFQINPVPDDVVPNIEISKPDPLKQVEVPPPPPTTDFTLVEEVTVPIFDTTDGVPDFVLTEIDFGDGATEIVTVDGEEQPIIRIAPVFPSRFSQGNYSGYCNVRFDVNAQGQTFNVQTLSCTNSQLNAPTIKSVQKWFYKAKIQNGRAVSRSGLETKIRFDLSDERGRKLPLPTGA